MHVRTERTESTFLASDDKHVQLLRELADLVRPLLAQMLRRDDKGALRFARAL